MVDTLYHFDLYRINTIEELFDMGYEEYFFGIPIFLSNGLKKLNHCFPDSFIQVYLDETAQAASLVKIGSLVPVSLSKKLFEDFLHL